MRNHEIPLCPLCLCVLCVEHSVQQRATMSCKNVVDGFLFKHRGHSNCVQSQAVGAGVACLVMSQTVPSRIMALRIVSILRMQATMATFLGLPAAMRRW